MYASEMADTDRRIDAISTHLSAQKLLSADQISRINRRVASLQKKVNYNGDYDQWIQKHLPVRLEDLLSQTG
jgi:hypothetical protein